MNPLSPPNTIQLARASHEQTSEGLEQRAPVPQSTSDMMGVPVRPLPHRQQTISTLDHAMQLLGNPLQTLNAVQDQLWSNGSTSLLTASTLAPNELAKSYNHLVQLSEDLRNAERSLANPRINRDLPGYSQCTRLLQETREALSTTLTMLENKTDSLEHYQMSLGNLSSIFSNFTTVLHELVGASRREDEELRQQHEQTPPGAYRISAEEAASQGSFLATDAPHLRRIETPEATALPETSGTLLDSKKEKKLATLQKKVPVVEAEVPMMWVHGIPAADAAVVDATTHD